MSAYDGAVMVGNGAVDLGEGYIAYLTLHMVTMESSESDVSPGMMWAAQAPTGSSGRLRVQVCVDCTLSPLGRWAVRGTVAGMILVAGASVVRKWLIAPESRMAHCLMVAALVNIVVRRTEAASA